MNTAGFREGFLHGRTNLIAAMTRSKPRDESCPVVEERVCKMVIISRIVDLILVYLDFAGLLDPIDQQCIRPADDDSLVAVQGDRNNGLASLPTTRSLSSIH